MKTTTKPISPRQLQALQASLRAIGISSRDDRCGYLSDQTGRPVNSSKELTFDEAQTLLSSLNGDRTDKANELQQSTTRSLVSKIYKLSFRIWFLNADYRGIHTPEDFEMNKAKINAWARRYSGLGKNITQMNVGELEAVLVQLGKISREHQEKLRED